jgi:hypothetical protein
MSRIKSLTVLLSPPQFQAVMSEYSGIIEDRNYPDRHEWRLIRKLIEWGQQYDRLYREYTRVNS